MTMLHIAGGIVLGAVGLLVLGSLMVNDHVWVALFVLFLLATAAFT
jgi:hypothetical protein